MVKNIVFWKTSFGSRKSGFLDLGTQNDTLQYVRKTNLARLLGCKIQGLPIYLVRYSGHTAVSERSMEDNYFLLFWNQHSRAMQVDMVGGLRLSPAISPLSSSYLPAIFQLSSPSMPIWSRLSPAISPLSPPSMSMWSRLSPAISGYLHPSMDFFQAISGYLRLSPGYLPDIFRC